MRTLAVLCCDALASLSSQQSVATSTFLRELKELQTIVATVATSQRKRFGRPGLRGADDSGRFRGARSSCDRRASLWRSVAIGGDQLDRHEHVAIKQLPMISLIATWRSKCDRFDRHRSLPKRPGHSQVPGVWGAVNGAKARRGLPGAGLGRPSYGMGPGLPRALGERVRAWSRLSRVLANRRGFRLAADYAR